MSNDVSALPPPPPEAVATSSAPSREAYDDLVVAYDHFNVALFDGQLPGVLFTFQRNPRFLGVFSRRRFQHAGTKQVTDEIAMNPAYFAVRPIEAVLSTLVHEMTHQWQEHFGNAGRRGYHNREFADKMKEIGLQTSSNGKPGGKEVGEAMSHFILPDGAFMAATKRLLETDFKLSWLDRFPLVADFPAYIPSEEELRALYPDEYGGDAPVGDLPPPLLAPVLAADGMTPLVMESDGPTVDEADVEKAGTASDPDTGESDGLPKIVVPPKGAKLPVLSPPPSTTGLDIEMPAPKRMGSRPKTTRCKFVCPACGDAAWGKPGLHLICGKCKTRMPANDGDEGGGDSAA